MRRLSKIERSQIGRFFAPIIATVLSGLICSAVPAENWPVVRGDTLGSGVANTTLPDQLETLWTYKAADDAGFDATAIVVQGIVYVGDNMGTFHAVRLADGLPVWTKQFEDGSFAAGAAFDNGKLYVGDLNGIVRCLAAVGGEELWSANVEGEIYAGPTPHGDDVLVTSELGTLTCLNAADGKLRWQPFRIEAPLRCSPTILSGRAMLSGCDSLLHIIDVSDGTEIQTVKIDGPTGATAAIHENRAYFGTEGGTFFAIDIPVDGADEPQVAWTFRDPRRGQPIRAAAAVTSEIVVVGSQGKAIYGLDPATGNEKWQPITTRSRIESSPVIAGEHVVAATAAGKIYLIDVKSGEVKWEQEMGGSFTASPAVVDNRIILGNGDGTLYCFGSKEKQEGSTTETQSTRRTEPDERSE
jgi:outer membrane protein assembly factor BamB